MKFIFVNVLMGMYRGGGENFDLNLSRELAEMGHEIEIYYLTPIFKKQKFKIPEYAIGKPIKSFWFYQITQFIHTIPFVKNVRGFRGAPRIAGQLIFEFIVFLHIALRKNDEFVLHICSLGFLGLLATKLLKRKVYVRFPGPPSFSIHCWFINNVYGVVANGDAYKAILKKCNKPKVLKLEIGINTGLFSKKHDRRLLTDNLKLQYDKQYILFVGRLIEIKNVSMLIKMLGVALKNVKNIEMIIVGEGQEKNKLVDLSFKLGLSNEVHFVGEKRGGDLRDYYDVSDIFVISSHYDNYPNVVIEAMSMQLPVVATRVGGIPLQVDHNHTGYLVNPGDYNKMAEHVSDLLTNTDKRLRMGKSARGVVLGRHNWKKTAQKFVNASR
jgi:glycosyltransferase involved in cell wall biosynthesis